MKNNLLKLVSGSLIMAGCSVYRDAGGDRPNIVFIVVDDLGWSDLGCYGADLHETPHIDRLASKGVLFTNSYSAAPVRSPTRASIMTGKYPARLNFTIWSEAASVAERKNQEIYRFLPPQTIESLPLEEITLAEKLKEKGYLTAHIGKWHLGDLMHFPESQGFDVGFAASQRGAPPSYFYPYKGEAFGEYRFVTDMGTDAGGSYFTDRKGEYLTDRLTDEAMKIMEDAGSQPFYLNLWYYNVHTPIQAKANDIEYFKTKIIPGIHHQNETYASMVKAVDDNVGRLLKKLGDLRISHKTVVILISDNGGYINEYKGKTVTSNYPLRSGKGSLYEGGIRIPTIITYPDGNYPCRKTDVPVSTVDFFPTILEITGIDALSGIDGRSFLQVLKGIPDSTLMNRPLFWHYPHYYPTTTPVSAIRKGNWKLLEYLEDGRTELFDLSADQGESRNLAGKEPQIANELLQTLRDWRIRAGAKGITINPEFRQ